MPANPPNPPKPRRPCPWANAKSAASRQIARTGTATPRNRRISPSLSSRNRLVTGQRKPRNLATLEQAFAPRGATAPCRVFFLLNPLRRKLFRRIRSKVGGNDAAPGACECRHFSTDSARQGQPGEPGGPVPVNARLLAASHASGGRN